MSADQKLHPCDQVSGNGTFKAEAICSNCRNADFAGAFSGHIHTYVGPVWPEMVWCMRQKGDDDRRWTWLLSDDCQFCAFLTTTSSAPFSSNQEMKVLGDALAPGSLTFLINDQEFGVVEAEPSQIEIDRHQFISRPVPWIDCYDHIRDLILSTCNQGCAYNNDLPLISPIKVLDCQTRQIQNAPDKCSYLTLSYVWGDPTVPSSASEWPQTIEDAISVTMKLGYRYLWVDKYCINQEDTPEKQIQIEQMDRIYRNAQACLVAVTGHSSRDGLAGVSVARTAKEVTMDGLTYAIRDSQPIKNGVTKSSWYQRGWTFQELMFSRKRIYFTEFEVTVECGGGTSECQMARESDGFQGEKSGSERQSLLHMSWRKVEAQQRIWDFIRDYSSRSLKYPSDILRAFLGVYNATDSHGSQPQAGLHDIWGLPISDPRSNTPTSNFGKALMWWPGDSASSMERRPGFPSFSWVGWFGASGLFGEPATDGDSSDPEFCSVWVELESGAVLDMEQFWRASLNQLYAVQLSSFIHVECLWTPVEIRWYPTPESAPSLFVGANRDHWFRPFYRYHYSLRSDLCSRFGQGAQKHVGLSGLLLQEPCKAFKEKECFYLFYDMGDY